MSDKNARLPLVRMLTVAAIVIVIGAMAAFGLLLMSSNAVLPEEYMPEDLRCWLPIFSALAAAGAALCGTRRRPHKWFTAAILSILLTMLLLAALLCSLFPQLNMPLLLLPCLKTALIAIPAAWLCCGLVLAKQQRRAEKTAALQNEE